MAWQGVGQRGLEGRSACVWVAGSGSGIGWWFAGVWFSFVRVFVRSLRDSLVARENM